MSNIPYYKFFVGDYHQKTKHLSMLEHGAYRLLIDHYMATRTPLPNDPAKLYRICGARSPGERRAVLTIIEDYFDEVDGLLRNERCDSELGNLLNLSDSQSAKAKQRHSRGSAAAETGEKQPESAPDAISTSQFRFKSESKLEYSDSDKQLNLIDTDNAAALPARVNHIQKDIITTTNPTTAEGDPDQDADYQKIFGHGVKLFPNLERSYAGIILVWLQGGGLVSEICSVLSRERGKEPKSWNYFDKAVQRAIDARKAKAAKPPAKETPDEYRRWFRLMQSDEMQEHFKLRREVGEERAIEQTRHIWERKGKL